MSDDYSATEDRTMPVVCYALYLLAFATGVTAIAGLVIAYAQRAAAGPVNPCTNEPQITDQSWTWCSTKRPDPVGCRAPGRPWKNLAKTWGGLGTALPRPGAPVARVCYGPRRPWQGFAPARCGRGKALRRPGVAVARLCHGRAVAKLCHGRPGS